MPAGKANLGPNFYPKLVKICTELGMKPEDLLAIMISESGLNPSAYEQKFKGSGLIGFMPSTLKGLGYKGTWEDFKETSGEEQLDYVKKVVQTNMKLNGGPFTSAAQYYTSNLWPVALKLPGIKQGNPSTPILEDNPETVNVNGQDYSKKYYDVGYKITASSEKAAYKANPLFDRDKKGSITYGDMMKQVEINKRNPLYQKALIAMKESSGYSPGQEQPTMVAEKDDKDNLFRQFLKKFKFKEGDLLEDLKEKQVAKAPPAAPASAPPATNTSNSIINKYLSSITASQSHPFISIAGERVERQKTEVSEPQMAQAIIEAWSQLFGEKPAKEQVALILAQNALETGHRKFMWNFNVGNITTDGKGSFDYYDDLTTDEQIKPGVWKKMNLKYRSYPTLKDGVLDYLKILSKSTRYSKAWQNIVHPDPAAFSKALKEGGYYTANEAPYTKNLTSLFSKFNKSNSYELAMSGKVESPTKSQVAMKPVPSNKSFNDVLDTYLQQIAASEKKNKKLYKQFLPKNNIVIQIHASSYTDAVEFSRVLCSVLDTELLSTSFVHTDGQNIEVDCSIPGPSQDCLNAVQELTQSTAEAFQTATHKIGGIRVKNQFFMNKKSSYEKIDPIFATNQYRKFLLKFV